MKVHVEEIFRGNKYPEPSIIDFVSYKADYKLIPKDEEQNYINDKALAVRIVPRLIELPPLLKELMRRENISNGDQAEKDNEVEISYVQGPYARYRIAKEGEKPDFEVNMGLGTPAATCLYEGIGLNFSK